MCQSRCIFFNGVLCVWFFDGDIVATCDACGAQHDIAVSELEVDCYGGEYHENGMGKKITTNSPKSIYAKIVVRNLRLSLMLLSIL